MDALTALRLQMEWGADEAILDAPSDRLRTVAPTSAAPPARAAATLAESGPLPVPRVTNAATADQARHAAQPADTLEALRAAISGFTGCAIRDTAANTILPEGELDSHLILIGESPTANDDRAGRVFAGAEGEFLEKALASIGLARADCLIAPLLPWRPPGDRPPSQSELAVCLPFLWRLLALAKTQHALVLGPVATKALIGTSRRLKRGAWAKIDVPDRSGILNILASVSIAQTKRTPVMKRELWSDLRHMYRALHPNITKK